MAYVTNNWADRLFAYGLGNFCNNEVTTLIIYKGSIPLDGDVDSWTEASRSANELARTSGTFDFQVIDDTAVTNQPRVIFDTVPPSFNASATGEATWYVMTPPGGSPIPDEYFMGDVSSTDASPLGDGTLVLDDTSLQSGNPVIVISFSIGVNGIG